MRNFKMLSLILSISSFLAGVSALAATYEVPVSPELRQFARFTLQPPMTSRNGKVMYVKYKLPAELVGPSHPDIIMQTEHYNDAKFVLTSKFGVASCVRGEATTCNVKYKNFQINSAEVKEFLRQKSKSSTEFQGRMQVAMAFGTDPVGILTY